MFCEDLSPYHYHGCPTGLPGTYSVGWLSSAEPFKGGNLSVKLAEKIRHYSSRPIRLMRGHHHCDFCQASKRAKGNGEAWLRSSHGEIYVSPQLLPHYIEEHGYLPPAEFLAIFDSDVECVSEEECRSMLQEHSRRLATAPSRKDILIALYETQFIWGLECFSSVLDFCKYLDWYQGPGPQLPTNSLCRRSEGYCLSMECRAPATAYQEIASRFKRSGSAPYMYRYRLVYLKEPWEVIRI